MKKIFILMASLPILAHAQLNHSFSEVSIPYGECIVVSTKSGGSIFIPENAFDGTKKQKCSKNLTLKYREFNNPYDMASAKIKMKNKSNKYLESAAMFEIYVTCDGENIGLAPGKNITYRLPEKVKNTEKYRSYKYNFEEIVWNIERTDFENINFRFEEDKKSFTSTPIPANTISEEIWGEMYLDGDNSVYVQLSPEEMREMKKRDSLYQVAYTQLDISDYGLYNYDKTVDSLPSMNIVANFQINKKTLADEIYVIYRDINSVFTFPQSTWKTSFRLIKNKDYDMFALLEDGSVAKLSNKPNLNELKNNSYTFILKQESVKPKNSVELANILK